jgi:hypothetical protein
MPNQLLKSFVLVALAAAPAVAQRPLHVALSGGASVPLGRFGEGASLGWHATGTLWLTTLMQPMGLRLDVSHSRTTAISTGPDQAITSGTLNLTYRIPMTNSILSPYVIAGAGAYNFQCFGSASCDAATRFGWNAGIGTKFVARGQDGFLESRLHAVNAKSGNVRYVPITIGLIF